MIHIRKVLLIMSHESWDFADEWDTLKAGFTGAEKHGNFIEFSADPVFPTSVTLWAGPEKNKEKFLRRYSKSLRIKSMVDFESKV